ncbi:hypothetical protein V1477_006240 [Vespula maculifrons]|uniref:Uncharacterized protein n=1 Tax=Vespula maculifrons TaxID=7453 RepID=A0ABD2CJX3_VESMC
MRKVDQAMDIVQIVPQCSYVLTNKGRDKPLEAFQFTVLALSLESAYLINRSHHLTDYMDRVLVKLFQSSCKVFQRMSYFNGSARILLYPCNLLMSMKLFKEDASVKLYLMKEGKQERISPMILDTVFITTPEENKDQRQRYKIQVLRILASARCNYKKQALQEHDCLPPWPFAIAKSDQ